MIVVVGYHLCRIAQQQPSDLVLLADWQFFTIDWQTVGIAAFAFTIWPILATYAKRFHDLGWSGWWSLLLFIPIVNIAVLLYLGMQEGELERNEHGPAPS